jgi:heme A synthase
VWLAGMSADPEPILTYHRWLGVAIGITGAGLALWAWKRPWEDRGAGMILALTLMTVAIAVQGFLGAGVTHGMDHLMF